ncbi:MAG: hypothetical protein OEZ06_06190 [Myxococcales bacterium]|nr:hypothetical protein [Myxococcales bacterium]
MELTRASGRLGELDPSVEERTRRSDEDAVRRLRVNSIHGELSLALFLLARGDATGARQRHDALFEGDLSPLRSEASYCGLQLHWGKTVPDFFLESEGR